MSGWYRTGRRFAVDHWNVKPDILTTAKGCTGAYAPVGVTATTAEIRKYFEEKFFAHGHTYSMHPLTLAAIPAAVKEYERLIETGLPRRASEHLARGLRELMASHKSIGDIRGLGHFWAVELVRDRETKEPFNTKADKAALKPLLIDKLSAEMLKRGVYLSSWYNHFVIAPPLVITEAEIDKGLAALDEVLEMADHEAN